jgi:outer membrane protein OmpA-like peptidoglycan-associated protein
MFGVADFLSDYSGKRLSERKYELVFDATEDIQMSDALRRRKMPNATVRVFLIVAVLTLTQACASSVNQAVTFEPGSIDAQRYVRKVDQFVVIADGSLSMADRWHRQSKLAVSGEFLVSLNQTIPELGFEGALRTFGRGLCSEKGKTLEIVPLADYQTAAFGDGITAYHCANGSSPLNRALDAVSTDLPNHTVPTAVIIVSDGLNMGKKEIAAAQNLKKTFGESVALYAVQIGGNGIGRALLERVVGEGGAGYVKQAAELSSSDAMAAFVTDVFLYPDDDGDGVPNHLDKCPDTPHGVTVDAHGCPVDSDGDGVPDYLDKCPGTPQGVRVDARGCPVDSDGDGVPDYLDKCPGTPKGVQVDSTGCPVDSDGDGVPDYLDKCPGTPKGVPVNAQGCPHEGIEVAGDEWMVRGTVLFAVNESAIQPGAHELLNKVAVYLRENPQYAVEIQGNTDNTGPMAWNMKLSEMRAESVKAYLVTQGVDAARLTTKGFGPNDPIVPNDTAANRAKNRRVDFKPSLR